MAHIIYSAYIYTLSNIEICQIYNNPNKFLHIFAKYVNFVVLIFAFRFLPHHIYHILEYNLLRALFIYSSNSIYAEMIKFQCKLPNIYLKIDAAFRFT